MARYEHLRLARLPEQLERRKRPGFGSTYPRDRHEHSTRLKRELDEAVDVQQRRRRPGVITPSLILRVQMKQDVPETDWDRVGLTLLSSDADKTLVLFSSTDEMKQFRERLDAYAGGIPKGQKQAPYAAFASAIESIGAVGPRDRIGLRLREAGFTQPHDFDDAVPLLDLELWDFGERLLRELKVQEISALIEAGGGEVLDRYIGQSITMLRVRIHGELIRELLSVEEVASIDLPPEPDVTTGELMKLSLGELPSVGHPGDDAPVIGIIDSGINAHPLIEDILVGSIGVPESLGRADEWGHGTRVAGIAVFGDLRTQLAAGSLIRGARLCFAKVINDRGAFDDRMLVPSQMRHAITSLYEQFGCRIFVIALGDTKMPYRGGKVGAWAATLDELVRELNVVICVSAGNRKPRVGDDVEQAVTEYPRYLMEDGNRFLEPGGAMNVITVGALAHGEGINVPLSEEVAVRTITRSLEPSPFTRVGPGIGGALKPDVVDFGGTMVLDPVTLDLKDGDSLESAGLLTLHHRPAEQLFTARSGTSVAAPLVAFKASQLFKLFPSASANLIRALMIGAANVPEEALQRVRSLDTSAERTICGHGQIDLERAGYSDDGRVVLFAEDELPLDHFAVYQVPIPDAFQTTRGRRMVRVTLAFDPPVRHTRADYAGVTMNFRLKRGCDPAVVFEHFRKRTEAEGTAPEIESRFDCALKPGPQSREAGTVQCARVEFKTDISGYGDAYYLVVRCEAGWAANRVQSQRFAVVVELAHEAKIQLYERLRVRLPS